MKASSIKTPRTGAEWAQQTLERDTNAAIVKVLFNPRRLWQHALLLTC